MNKKLIMITRAFTASVFILSCEKENTMSKPVIQLTELGYENSKTTLSGSELHIDAELFAEAKIDRVAIEIHPEGEHAKKGTHVYNEEVWEVDTTYTKFSGLKNTTFHEHIDVPAGAEPGHYHFHLSVTDQEGQQTLVEEEIEILAPAL